MKLFIGIDTMAFFSMVAVTHILHKWVGLPVQEGYLLAILTIVCSLKYGNATR